MSVTIGIRREDLTKKGEKRVAIVPSMVSSLQTSKIKVLIQPAKHPTTGEIKRAFTDKAYEEKGGIISEDLQQANVIVGIKEVDIQELLPQKTYLFFSHTHKGQIKNRPLLQALTARNITLIDYELLTNSQHQRILTAFTFFAGYAGITDSLWTFGQRMNRRGIVHPFSKIGQSVALQDLEEVKKILQAVGEEIQHNGTPTELPPFITCFMGNGKTSKGAQEIYDYLPVEEIDLASLPSVFSSGSRNKIYKLVMDIPELYRLKKGSHYKGEDFSYQDLFQLYLKEPDHFESNMDQVFPYASMWMNCIIWSPKFPRLISREQTAEWYATYQTLEVIGDITCDPEGAIHFSQETWIDQPVFIYDPIKKTSHLGVNGSGIAVMAVTNLPCEFAADASIRFSEELAPVWESISRVDWEAESPEEGGVDELLARAMILWKGNFTEPYLYMKEYLTEFP